MQNLNEEYRKLCERENPDLWNRIESGLSEKKPVKKIRANRARFLRYAPLAAAAVLLIAVVPFLMSIQNKSDSSDGALRFLGGEAMDAGYPQAECAEDAAEFAETTTAEDFGDTDGTSGQAVGAPIEDAVLMDNAFKDNAAAETVQTDSGSSVMAESEIQSNAEDMKNTVEKADASAVTAYFLTQVPEADGAEITVDLQSLYEDADGSLYYLVTVASDDKQNGVNGRFCVGKDLDRVYYLDETQNRLTELSEWRQ